MPQAPQATLRAMFAGIGRILNVTDKLRGKPAEAAAPETAPAPVTTAPEPDEAAAPDLPAPEDAAPETPEPEATAQETAEPGAEASDAPAPEDTATETPDPEPAAVEAEAAAPETIARETIARETAVPEAGAPEAAEPEGGALEADAPEADVSATAAEPPLPNYDSLTIASVRARLRNLSLDQLAGLIEYEKANAGREDFIAAFERRIAKIQSEE